MQIPSSVLRLVDVAARDNTRYAIAGVQICKTDAGCVARVTDGRRLLELRVPFGDLEDNETWEALVPAHLIRAALAWKTSTVEICLDDGQVCFSARGDGVRLTAADVTVDGRFPSVEGIIPEYSEDEADTICLDPELLTSLLETLKALLATIATSDPMSVHMTIPRDRTRPILFRSNSEAGSVVAVMMPRSV
jgi:DNA polymerase III sliding clamp (beta) subunit (PCNA family)